MNNKKFNLYSFFISILVLCFCVSYFAHYQLNLFWWLNSIMGFLFIVALIFFVGSATSISKEN